MICDTDLAAHLNLPSENASAPVRSRLKGEEEVEEENSHVFSWRETKSALNDVKENDRDSEEEVNENVRELFCIYFVLLFFLIFLFENSHNCF